MGWNVESILRSLRVDFESEGDGPSIVDNAASLERAGQGDLSFCSAREGDAISQIMESGAGVIICRKELRVALGGSQDAGSFKIAIIGTSVIPEFQTASSLAVVAGSISAVISVIIVSRRLSRN